jgi:hypothetical protein
MNKPCRFGTSMVITAAMIFGCNDTGRHAPDRHPSRGQLTLDLRTTLGGADLKYNTMYRTPSGRSFSVSDFRYYLSNIKAIREDGSAPMVESTVLLIDPHRRCYDLGQLPVGSYKAIRFDVGLDSAVNHGDPTLHEAPDPLAIQTPGMHWDWNSGYLFMKMEGKVDTTAKGSGTPTTEFYYHLGMDEMKRTLELTTGFTIMKTGACTTAVRFELDSMMAGTDLRTETVTHTFDNLPLANRLADRWKTSFSAGR